MSLFESASLVVTPNGTKASKLYAIKPTDGSGDLSVTRATTATRVNSSGLIESSAVNVPRLDYTNSSCPSILVEPQRTNLALRSEEFNLIWSQLNVTITANVTTAPDGTSTADKLVENATNNQHRIDQTTTSAIGTNTFSVFAKKSERDSIWLRVGTSGAYFDLTNGTVSGATAGVTTSIVNYGNGWYKCSIVRTSTVANEVVRINLAIWINGTYLGDGTSGLFIWGAQLEASSYPTSYIPTTTASVTRNADVISKTGISSLIGQTEGTLFVDCKDVKVGLSRLFEIFNLSNTGTNMFLNLSASGALQIILNGATVDTATGNVVDLDKVIFKYTADSIKLFNNGVLIGSYSGAVSFSNALDTLAIGGTTYTTRTINGNIKLVGLWETALTDQECINLTTI